VTFHTLIIQTIKYEIYVIDCIDLATVRIFRK